jgi:DNA repair exonuclease SbcCD ATPase subunit
LAALTEERNKLNARIQGLESQLNQMSDENSKFKALEEQIRSLRESKQQPAAPPPDYLDDPKAYVDHQAKSVVDELRSVKDQVSEVVQAGETTKEQLQQQTQIQQLQSMAGAAEENFAKTTPDYWEALEHMRTVRVQQLKLMFPDATDAQVQQHIRGEEFQAAATCLQRNVNPAEYAYSYAKSVGYQPAAKEDAEKATAEAEDLAARKDLAESLGSGGSANDADLENLVDLNNAEFDAAMKEMFG